MTTKMGIGVASILTMGLVAGCEEEPEGFDPHASDYTAADGTDGAYMALPEGDDGGAGGGGTYGKIVTIGDSYASGTGIHTSGSGYDERDGGLWGGWLKLTARDDYECWREKDTTPGPRRAARAGARSEFLACKGAEVWNASNQVVLYKQQYATNAPTEFIVSIGGNDLRTAGGKTWPDLLKHCIWARDCHRTYENRIVNYYDIENRLAALYDDIYLAAPHATVAILGYPEIMQPWVNWTGELKCPEASGINGQEAAWIDAQVATLNRRIQGAVRTARYARPGFDIHYVPTTSYFPSGGCDGNGSDAYINDSTWGSDASFHPSQKGYDAYYSAIQAKLGSPDF